MRIGQTHFRSIWMDEDPGMVNVIDQRALPYELKVIKLKSGQEACEAIADMAVRGAPLIGVTAAFGIYLAARRSSTENYCEEIRKVGMQLAEARPTAVNLQYAIDLALHQVDCTGTREGKIDRLFHLAVRLAEDEVERCRLIGEHGLPLIEEIYQRKGKAVDILTHCNAGWLACVDYGTATAPVYLAHDRGIPVHVWVDETRPRNQGARLTAWELGQHGVPHTIIVDNAGGHLMQAGKVDMVLVGSDRTTRNGDVVNKIGTYLKALAARDNRIPFYVALPSTSIDIRMHKGNDTVIEERERDEVACMEGWSDIRQAPDKVRLVPEGSAVSNPGFDITPSRLVSGLITEKGICNATEKGILTFFGT